MMESTPDGGIAEVAKRRDILVLGELDVARLLDPVALLDGLAEGFRALTRAEVQTPDRPEIAVPGLGFLLAMPAWRRGAHITVKLVSVFGGNAALDLPSHLAVINLFDPASGVPVCVMDGTYITGLRTAACAILSVRELARQDARIATIVGAGVQGREHLKLLPLVRDFDEIRVVSLHRDDADTLARRHPAARAVDDIEMAVRHSDVVCLCSHAREPVIDAGWVRPGTHVTSVGYAPPHGELPAELARRNALYVETVTALADPPVGCAELRGIPPAHAIELGALLMGSQPGRVAADQITVYKAMGIAMEDMVAANLVFAEAQRLGIGQRIML
jgi:ornithine cyclodeaminase/thiomorpholine-carboxylate dehydrogenase